MNEASETSPQQRVPIDIRRPNKNTFDAEIIASVRNGRCGSRSQHHLDYHNRGVRQRILIDRC
jgi:hypothetical protein